MYIINNKYTNLFIVALFVIAKDSKHHNCHGKKSSQIIIHPYEGMLWNLEKREWDFLCVLIWMACQNKVLNKEKKNCKKRVESKYTYIFVQVYIKYLWKEI